MSKITIIAVKKHLRVYGILLNWYYHNLLRSDAFFGAKLVLKAGINLFDLRKFTGRRRYYSF